MNMKRLKSILTVSSLLIIISSCTLSYPALDVTSNSVGSKKGVAERRIWLGIAFGHTNTGIQKAAENGNIDKVATVDYQIKGGLFSTTYRCIVTGE